MFTGGGVSTPDNSWSVDVLPTERTKAQTQLRSSNWSLPRPAGFWLPSNLGSSLGNKRSNLGLPSSTGSIFGPAARRSSLSKKLDPSSPYSNRNIAAGFRALPGSNGEANSLLCLSWFWDCGPSLIQECVVITQVNDFRSSGMVLSLQRCSKPNQLEQGSL